MSRMRVRIPYLSVRSTTNNFLDSIAGQMQALKTGSTPQPRKKKQVAESSDDESNTEEEADDTSETDTDTDEDA